MLYAGLRDGLHSLGFQKMKNQLVVLLKGHAQRFLVLKQSLLEGYHHFKMFLSSLRYSHDYLVSLAYHSSLREISIVFPLHLIYACHFECYSWVSIKSHHSLGH